MVRPPIGAMLLGLMALLTGIVDLIQGLRLLGLIVLGPGQLGSGLAFYGGFSVLIGAAWFAVAYAFWTTQGWAWLLGMILALFGIVNAIFVLFSTESLAQGLGVAILPIVVIWYLQQPRIKAVFNVADD